VSNGANNKKAAKIKKESNAALYVILSLWAFTTIFPFIWVINNSFKDRREIISSSFTLPSQFTLENYRQIFSNENFTVWGAYANSLIISTTVCVAVILFASLFAFAMTRYVFPANKFLYFLLIAAQMIPAFSTIIPVFKIIMSMGLRNNIFSVALVQIAGNLAFATIVLVGYMRSLPITLEEAAYMEGCNVFQVLKNVIFPLSRPAFATVAIFSFIWSYNDLFSQIFFLRDKRSGYTINRLLNEISSLDGGTNYGLMAASIVLIVVPVILIYMALQKNIIKGLTSGAVKG
jgi:raffinose/stachyose/melibiose transport system permease protein